MNIKWQSATTRPATHHAFQITEEIVGRLHSVNVYEFRLGELSLLHSRDTLQPGDWIVKTEKGFEHFTAEKFKQHYMEP